MSAPELKSEIWLSVEETKVLCQQWMAKAIDAGDWNERCAAALAQMTVTAQTYEGAAQARERALMVCYIAICELDDFHKGNTPAPPDGDRCKRIRKIIVDAVENGTFTISAAVQSPNDPPPS